MSVHVGWFVNVTDAVDSVTDVNVVTIGELGVITFLVDEISGAPKSLALV